MQIEKDVVVTEITWDSIYEEFEIKEFQDRYDDTNLFVNWLSKNYNVPTPKN